MGYTDVPGVLRVAPFIEYGCHGVQFGLSGVTQGGERQERDFCNRPPVPLGLRVVPFDSRAQSRVDGGLAGDAGHQFSRYSIGPEHVVKDRIGARERELQSWRPNDEERSNYRKRNVIRSLSESGDAEQSICLGLLDLLFLVLLRSGFGFCLALGTRIEECIKVRLWLQRAASNQRKDLIR